MEKVAPVEQITDAEKLPLVGVRVIEFSQTVMGPTAGLVLADLGAEVVKVEATPSGDPTRSLVGFGSGMFAYYNRNKRSAAIDAKSSEGRALIHRLAARADVLVENLAPATMDRLGCGWDDLSALNPRLIYLSLKGFLSGPYEHRAALDEVVQFMGGLAYMTGPTGRPLRAGASVTDILGGTLGAAAVLAALHERDRTGRGRLVKGSLFESVAFMMGQFMAGIVRLGRDMPPMPDRESSWPVYDTFDTADGEKVFVAVTSDKLWKGFVEAFGLTELEGDERLATLVDRIAARSWTLPLIAEKLASLPTEEIARRCEQLGCGWAPVAKPSDLFDDPQLASGHMLDMDIYGRRSRDAEPELLRVRVPALPVELDDRVPGLRRQPPHYGQHTREVLSEIGVGADDYEALADAGVVVQGADAE